MTALRDAIDYTTLGWVKPELDETLRQARIEIEGFVDDPVDTSHMRFCASYLHQVQGTLRMVELYAPAMVTEEMERLALALQNGEVGERERWEQQREGPLEEPGPGCPQGDAREVPLPPCVPRDPRLSDRSRERESGRGRRAGPLRLGCIARQSVC